jgi:hypothetical protein
LQPAKVTGRKLDNDGNPLDGANTNPILDSHVYGVTFQNGITKEYAANVIIENIFQQVDSKGNSVTYFSYITDDRNDQTALTVAVGFIFRNSHHVPRETTKGWYLQVLWKDGSSSWEPLHDLKESHPIEVAEYVIANKLYL